MHPSTSDTAVPGCVLATSALTHLGLVREENEDAILALPDAGLWVVADGMGGHEHGRYASERVTAALRELATLCGGHALVRGIPDVLQAVNTELVELSYQLGDECIVGSTVIVLAIQDDQYHCFWVGDSRCYLYQENSLTCLSRDHVERPGQLGNASSRKILLRAIGGDEQLELDYTSGYIYENDRFMLCSDGLHDHVPEGQLASCLGIDDEQTANQALLAAALAAGGADNISSVLVALRCR